MKRTGVVELVVDSKTGEKLKLLCSFSSKLWNEVSYPFGRERDQILKS